jgi:hypothetical protein
MTHVIEAWIEVPVYDSHRRARASGKRIEVAFAIPAVGANELDPALAITYPDGRRAVVHRHGDRLYMPFAGVIDWYGQVAEEEGVASENLHEFLGAAPKPVFQRMLFESTDHVRERVGLLKGNPDRVAAYARKAASEALLFVGGRLHRRVLEPVWQLERQYTRPDLNTELCLKLQVFPFGHARSPTKMFRFDRPDAALGYLRAYARNRRAIINETLAGAAEILAPFDPTEDEIVRCVECHGETFVQMAERALGMLSDRSVSDWCTMRKAAANISSEGRPAAERFAEALGRIVKEAKSVSASKDSEIIRNLAGGRWQIDAFLNRFAFERDLAPLTAPRP